MLLGLLRSRGSRVLLWDTTSAVNAGTFDLGARRMTGRGTAGSYGHVRSDRPLTGLAYVEVDLHHSAGGAFIGAGISGLDWTAVTGSRWIGDANDWAAAWRPDLSFLWGGSDQGTLTSSAPAGRISIAVRVASRRIWVRSGGADWFRGGDPVADTRPSATLGGAAELYVAATISASGSHATLCAVADHLHAPPAGFTAWG